jgi:hypothetical protein
MSQALRGQTPLVFSRRRRSLWGLTPLIGAVALIVGCGYSDAVTNAYATKAEAEQAGAVERGWVPRGLPESAREFREAHSVEGGRVWGLFSFAPEDGDALRALVDPKEISASGLRPEIPARIEWWPLLLRSTLDAEQIRSAGLQPYRSKDGTLVVIVNWKQGRAYYWK